MIDYRSQFYPEERFGGFTDADAAVAFYTRVNALAQPSFKVVDFGCGRGGRGDDPVVYRRNLSNLKEKVSWVIGIDVDGAGQRNARIDEFRLFEPGHPWPFYARSVDLIVSDFVLEHLPDPGEFFQEAKRVLVGGGFLCIRTPNANSYQGLATRLVPNRHHASVVKKVQGTRKDEDVFPTFYRCNTISTLRHHFRDANFRAVVYGYNPEPTYLNFAKLAYALGVLYQKLSPSFLGAHLFAFGQSQIN
ncbi:MAG: class I SAM-dependent methyltransferase [Terracidiphilus sp.]